jgi:hypothetical protein
MPDPLARLSKESAELQSVEKGIHYGQERNHQAFGEGGYWAARHLQRHAR